METVDPELLLECAHALVDVLSRILHEEHNNPEDEDLISENITRTIWFAGDYPYPIARRTPTQARPAAVVKSGTFKDFEIRHEEAVDIFVEGVELQGLSKGPDEEELLQDSGVSGILDKLISVKAAIFISGSNKCSRKRSVVFQFHECMLFHTF